MDNPIQIESPDRFSDYQLIDSGGFEKLEKYGNLLIARPEPQAIWNKSLSIGDWQTMHHAWFHKARTTGSSEPSENGTWSLKPGTPEQWTIHYKIDQVQLAFRLGFTAFKHIGVFPEQAGNWEYLYKQIKQLPVSNPQVLNLFAYTGGASLAARAAGAEVSHVDSVKQVISWARENMEASGLNNIRWVVEDALKYLQREARREKKYHAIILDPPAYGRGPNGEKWLLEKNLDETIWLCKQILHTENSFLILNLYSLGHSSLIAETLLKNHFPNYKHFEMGEFFVKDQASKKLPLGIFARIKF